MRLYEFSHYRSAVRRISWKVYDRKDAKGMQSMYNKQESWSSDRPASSLVRVGQFVFVWVARWLFFLIMQTNTHRAK